MLNRHTSSLDERTAAIKPVKHEFKAKLKIVNAIVSSTHDLLCHSIDVRIFIADCVVDYTRSDPTKSTQPYDLIVDAAAYRPFADFLDVIVPGGTYVMVGGATSEFFRSMLLGPFAERFKAKTSRRRVRCLVSKPNQADLIVLKNWIEEGKLKPFVGRVYSSLAEVPTAIRYVEERQVKGKVAINL